MNVKQLKQEVTTHDTPTDGLKPVLVERLEQAMQHEQEKEKKISNEAFRKVYARLEPQLKTATEKEREIAELEGRLAAARTELEAAQIVVRSAQRELKKLEPRLSFNPKLPTSVVLDPGSGREESWRACCLREAGVERCGGDGQGDGNVQDPGALRRAGCLSQR
jgi:hypothetical protein